MMIIEKWSMIEEKIERLTENNESYIRYEDAKNELLDQLERELGETHFLKIIELMECCEIQKLIVAYEFSFREREEAG